MLGEINGIPTGVWRSPTQQARHARSPGRPARDECQGRTRLAQTHAATRRRAPGRRSTSTTEAAHACADPTESHNLYTDPAYAKQIAAMEATLDSLGATSPPWYVPALPCHGCGCGSAALCKQQQQTHTRCVRCRKLPTMHAAREASQGRGLCRSVSISARC